MGKKLRMSRWELERGMEVNSEPSGLKLKWNERREMTKSHADCTAESR